MKTSVAPSVEMLHLKRRLVQLDAVAMAVAWLPANTAKHVEGLEWWKVAVVEVALVCTGLALFKAQGLYLARVASSRTEEVRRVVRGVALLSVAQAAVLASLGVEMPMIRLAGTVVLVALAVLWLRGGYRAWLGAARAQGRFVREVVVIGANGDAADLVGMLGEHPEAGFRVLGVVGDRSDAEANGLDSLHLGGPDDVLTVLDRHGVNGVICVAGAVPARNMRTLLHELSARKVHVQFSTGLEGTSIDRLRATPVAFQSLYYLEPATNASLARSVKRVFDVLVAGVLVVLAAPVMAAIAIAIRSSDHGPVLFGQVRVGRDGRHFRVLKFRSMVVDAESAIADLSDDNERVGPLFKMTDDPRVTRVGRFLRATSLDELPQLFNVLRGEMSLVGPRPALPSEVAQFDARLLDRLSVPPGITGLWQVEARDNPHFGAYRRLDLFYVDNWTLGLDLMILMATLEQVVSRAARTLWHRAPRPQVGDVTGSIDLGAATVTVSAGHR